MARMRPPRTPAPSALARRFDLIVFARTPSPLRVFAIVAIAASLGSAHVCARFAFANGVSVLTAATVRSALASVLLLVLLRARGTPVLPLPRQLKPTLALGLLIAAQTVLIQTAVALLPVTLAILIFYSYPFLTGVAISLRGDERFTPQLAAALAAAFVGLALVLGVASHRVNVLGIAAGVGAAVSWALALVLTPKLAPGLGAPLRTFFMLTTAALVLAAAALVSHQFRLPQNAAGWSGLAGLSILYAVGIIGLFLLLPLLGAIRTAVALNLEPVAVALVAWLALGETLAPAQLAGAAIVVTAVMLYQLRGGRG